MDAQLDCVVSTTMVPGAVAASTQWLAMHASPYSTVTQRLTSALNAQIANVCGVNLAGPNAYRVVHTRGRAESATQMLVTAARAFATRTGCQPHVVVCGPETSGLARCARALEAAQSADVAVVPLGPAGDVQPDAFRRAIRDNTCIAAVAAVDVSTGTLADLDRISELVGNSVPLFIDASLLIGRVRFDGARAAAFSVDFACFGGPVGRGALVIRASLVAGYLLTPHVFGSAASAEACGALQGDPPNGAVSVAALSALRDAASDRRRKRTALAALHDFARTAIARKFTTVRWRGDAKNVAPGILVFTLPNHSRSGEEVRRKLAESGIYIGSVAGPTPATCILRLGLWHGTAKKDIERALAAIS